MNKIKLISTVIMLMLLTNTAFANFIDLKNMVFVSRKREQVVENKVDRQIKKFKNLRTTHVSGIYCQIVADDGTYRNQKHYFYNTQKEKLVEIPNVYYINYNNFEQALGKLLPEFIQFGAQSDEFTYKGKTYKIPTY